MHKMASTLKAAKEELPTQRGSRKADGTTNHRTEVPVVDVDPTAMARKIASTLRAAEEEVP
jgi:hypothetical protein